jgi:hypothetical protein
MYNLPESKMFKNKNFWIAVILIVIVCVIGFGVIFSAVTVQLPPPPRQKRGVGPPPPPMAPGQPWREPYFFECASAHYLKNPGEILGF